MSNETCPHCGAEREPPYNAYGLEEIEFVCGNTRDIATKKSSSHLSQKCYQRQIEYLTQSLHTERTAVASLCDEVNMLRGVLGKICNYAHKKSTAPAIKDGYWKIRCLAYAKL